MCRHETGQRCNNPEKKHPIPTVDKILYKVNGSEILANLTSGLEITPFVTNQVVYRCKRPAYLLHIFCSPEISINCFSSISCEDVQNMSYDIVVHGRNEEEHEYRMRAVLQRIKDKEKHSTVGNVSSE